jgi:hypothetical protein
MRMFSCLAVSLVLALAMASWADEQKIALDKVPAKVMAGAKQKFPKAKFLGASTEKENGQVQYEIELLNNEQHIDITLLEDGSIDSIEAVIAAGDLPKVVKDAIDAKYANSSIEKAEEITKKDQIASYEVILITAGKKKLEVVLKPDGKIEKEESKSEKKD